MKDNIKYLLVAALVVSLLIVPKIAFSSNGLYDSFNYSNTALAQTAVNDGSIELQPYENTGNTINRHANGWSVRWAVTSSIASLSLVTGLSPRELQSLPICAIGIIAMAFLVASRLTKDWRLAALYAVMISFDPTVNSLTNGTYIQGWGFIFYYMLIYVVLVMVQRGHHLALAGRSEHRRQFILFGSLAFCALAMMYFSYYSTLVYGAILIGAVAAGTLFAASGKPLKRRTLAIFIGLACLAAALLYVVEPTVRFTVSNFGGALGTFLDFGTASVAAGGARFYAGAASYLLIFLPICALGIMWLGRLVKDRRLPVMSAEDIVVSALLLTGLVNVVMYTGLGLVDFKYFIMFYSLCAIYAAKRLADAGVRFDAKALRKIPARQLFAVALVLLFAMKFGAYIAPALDDSPADESGGLAWINEYCINPGADSISDLRLSGEVMLLHAEKGHLAFNSFVFSATYLDRLEGGNRSEFMDANDFISYIMMTDDNMDGHFNVGNWETWDTDNDIVEAVGLRDNIHRIYSAPGCSVWYVHP